MPAEPLTPSRRAGTPHESHERLETALDGYVAQLQREGDRLERLRRSWPAQDGRDDPGAQALGALICLARVQRLSGWAMRAAVEQALAAGVAWGALAAAAQVPVDRLPGRFAAGGRVVVDDASSRSHEPGDGVRDAARGGPRTGRPPIEVDALGAVETSLAGVTQRLREAVADYETLRGIERDAAGDPAVSGPAGAHRILAAERWQAALGARAALKALYQQLAGRSSLQHAARAGQPHTLDAATNPVGRLARHAETAAFLAEHARGPDREPLHEPPRPGPDSGLAR